MGKFSTVLKFLIIFLISITLIDYFTDFNLLGDILYGGDYLFSLVTKKNSLDKYRPNDLVSLSEFGAPDKYIRKVAYENLKNMISDMNKENLKIIIISAYRSYNTQKSLFAFYYRIFGKSAFQFSAEAGHSEHQLGTTLDFGVGDKNIDLQGAFALTGQGQWLRNNAWKYGFVMSYPEGKNETTGYIYEPWHYRYIGKEASREFYNSTSSVSLEEYLIEYPQFIKTIEGK